jgi:hypothetical protein
MSTPCEEIRPELEALLGAMTEGALDAPGRKRLAEILHDHPEARQFYFDYCQMHAMLREAHGELSALVRPRRRILPWATAAAAVVLAALTMWIFRCDPGARLDGRRVAVGQIVRGGDLLYRDGSRAALVGEAAVHLDHLELREGVLRCDIPKRSTPFVIRTRQAEATVLGTSFEIASERDETRLSVTEGRVRLTAARAVEAGPGHVATADARGVALWAPICDLKLAELKELPPQIQSVFCPSETLHTPRRTIAPEPLGRFVPGGFHLGTPGHAHGLHVWRWTEEVGDDLLLEADVAGGERWSLGFAVSGDSFDGFRVIFAGLDRYPNGVAIDTIDKGEHIVFAQDPRPVSYDRDHTLRVEKRGSRMRAWVDRELRIDTEFTHPLGEGRRRVFSISNYGNPPILKGLRAWKLSP